MDAVNNDKLNELKRIVKESGGIHFTVKNKDGSEVRKRLFVSMDLLCEFRRRSRKVGDPLTTLQLREIETIVPVNGDADMEARTFNRNCKKVISMLEESGFWNDILDKVKFMQDLGYAKTREAYDTYFDFSESNTLAYEEWQKRREENTRKISEGFFEYNENAKGESCFLSDWVESLWSPGGVKKMFFGRTNNQWVLNNIKNALAKKYKYSSARYYDGSYDASFEYDPERKMAWYSEEYKNCGNGYYYLALSATHALFCEKD